MISFQQVSKTYPRSAAPALDRVDLDVERGEFVFLVGASGSGKSTLLRLVLREDTASSGAVMVAGRDVARLSSWKVPHLRRTIGVVFQDFRLLSNKSVHDNVAFALQVIGASRRHIATTVPETLELVGLADKGARLPHELSGGEQQRVAVARAYVNRPAILLADEPTGNLDPETSRGIMRLLDRINRTGTTVVMATHDTSIVDEGRKRVVGLDSGRVVRDDAQGLYAPLAPLGDVVATAADAVLAARHEQHVQASAETYGDTSAETYDESAVDPVDEAGDAGDRAWSEPAWSDQPWSEPAPGPLDAPDPVPTGSHVAERRAPSDGERHPWTDPAPRERDDDQDGRDRNPFAAMPPLRQRPRAGRR